MSTFIEMIEILKPEFKEINEESNRDNNKRLNLLI